MGERRAKEVLGVFAAAAPATGKGGIDGLMATGTGPGCADAAIAEPLVEQGMGAWPGFGIDQPQLRKTLGERDLAEGSEKLLIAQHALHALVFQPLLERFGQRAIMEAKGVQLLHGHGFRPARVTPAALHQIHAAASS